MLMKSWDFDDLPLPTLEKPEDSAAASGRYHVPVMAEEVVALLRPAPGLIFLDGTAGGGGHTEKFLQHGAEVVALDAVRRSSLARPLSDYAAVVAEVG